MTIEVFTKEEREFMLAQIASLNIPLSHPEAAKGATLGRSIIKKLEASLGIKQQEKAALASAARKRPAKKR